MKKATFLLVLMGVLIFPSTTFAFSFFDVFRFFSSEKKVESNTEVFTEEDKAIAEQKFKAWKEAYDNDNIKRVFRNERNFVLGEQEANYLADKRIEELDDPAMTSVDIEFKEGKIRVEGYLTKTLKGNIEATIKPQKDDGRVTPHITQARYRGFYFPTAVANMMLGKAIEEEVDFLHSHPTYKNIDVNITDERMKLDYSK